MKTNRKTNMKNDSAVKAVAKEKSVKKTEAAPAGAGGRAVVIVDRGWIFAGDVTEHAGRIRLARAVWVLRWEGIGFDGVLREPGSSRVHLRQLDHEVDLPADAEIFRVPVDPHWGLP